MPLAGNGGAWTAAATQSSTSVTDALKTAFKSIVRQGARSPLGTSGGCHTGVGDGVSRARISSRTGVLRWHGAPPVITKSNAGPGDPATTPRNRPPPNAVSVRIPCGSDHDVPGTLQRNDSPCLTVTTSGSTLMNPVVITRTELPRLEGVHTTIQLSPTPGSASKSAVVPTTRPPNGNRTETAARCTRRSTDETRTVRSSFAPRRRRPSLGPLADTRAADAAAHRRYRPRSEPLRRYASPAPGAPHPPPWKYGFATRPAPAHSNPLPSPRQRRQDPSPTCM